MGTGLSLMDGGKIPSGPLDIPTIESIAQRSHSHPLVVSAQFRPDRISPRVLELELDSQQYPDTVHTVRLDVRWFEGGDYSFHYHEKVENNQWHCRWDRHPKPDNPRSHYHPPPTAARVEPSPIDEEHHLGVLFTVLDWVTARVERIHESTDHQ